MFNGPEPPNSKVMDVEIRQITDMWDINGGGYMGGGSEAGGIERRNAYIDMRLRSL